MFNDPFEAALGAIQDREAYYSVYYDIGERYADALLEGLFERSGDGMLFAVNQESMKSGFSIETRLPNGKSAKNFLRPEDLKAIMELGESDPGKIHAMFKRDYGAGIENDIISFLKGELNRTFISCWHAASHESEAMWRLYAKETVEGVAIRTTLGSLKAALPPDRKYDIRRVQYREDGVHKKTSDHMSRFFTKRKAFEHEKEVRVVVSDSIAGSQNAKGVHVPVQVEKLVQRIILSPYAPPWLPQVVTDTAKKYGITADVVTSDLAKAPFHY